MDYLDYKEVIPKIEFFLRSSERLFKAAVLFTCLIPLGIGAAVLVGESFWLGFIIPTTLLCLVAAIVLWFKWTDFELYVDSARLIPVRYDYLGAKGLLKAYEAYRDEQFLRDAGL